MFKYKGHWVKIKVTGA